MVRYSVIAKLCVLISFFVGQAVGEDEKRQVSFELDVQPILTATGCNAGACHGKQRGQNGFQLSLLGFDSEYDFSAITKHARGRRIFPASPDNSLLLQKATAQVPHGGGKRIEPDSADYRVLQRWIEQGAKRSIEGETRLVKVELNTTRQLLKPGQQVTLKLIAHYADLDGAQLFGFAHLGFGVHW